MIDTDWRRALERALALALEYLDGLPGAHVPARRGPEAMLALLDEPVPAEGRDAAAVIDELARVVDDGLTAVPSGRFFGWVMGGGLPAALAADWLTGAWDQNAGSAEATPA